MSKILITGGAGYIGSHTILELAKTKKYEEIIVFDNLKNGNKKALDIISENFGQKITLIEGDLINFQQIEHAISSHKSISAVIHFAALIEAGVSVIHPTKFYENNVVGSLNLIKAMQKNNIKTIVFSSTAAVYGTPSDPLVTESTPLKPESAYGHSKLIVENILRSLAEKEVDESEKINSVILRYFNAAGSNPNQLIGQDYPKPTHLMTVAIEAALGIRDKLTIFGQNFPTKDGTCIRDYIHVQDLARAHVAALNYLDNFEGTDVFNVGTKTPVSNLDVVKTLEDIHGEFPYEFGDRRPGDPVAFYADNSKIKDTLGWEPEFTFEDALKHAYEWKKKYPEGYNSMSVE